MTKKEEGLTTEPEIVDATPEAEGGIPTEELPKDLSTDKIDYEAELKIAQEARRKAEEALAKKRFKVKREDYEEEEKEEEEEEIKSLSKEEVASMIQEENQKIAKLILENQANSLAEQFASEPAEKELIIEKWKGRTFPQGMSINEQIEEIYVIVNKKKLLSERNEALRALSGKERVNRDSSGTYQEEPKGKEPQLAPDVKSVLLSGGFVYNYNTKRHERKLPNGTVMYRDPATGKVLVEGLSQARS